MAQSHFEIAVGKKLTENMEALRRIPLGDSHKLAKLQGIAEGLEMALIVHREAARQDIDDAA